MGWISRLLGPSALTILTVGSPLLVLGVLSFEVKAPIVTAAWLVLCLWLFLADPWLRSAAVLSLRVTRLREILGAGTAAGIAIVGLGGLPPGMPWAQSILFGGRCFRRDRDARHPRLVCVPGAAIGVMTLLRQRRSGNANFRDDDSGR